MGGALPVAVSDIRLPRAAGIMVKLIDPDCYLQAINPYYLYRFFTTGQNSPLDAWKSTASIFLCLTGAEASYADLVGAKLPLDP